MTLNRVNYWTGIGSRKTPDDIQLMMRLIAKQLTDMGWILRSGGAEGADTACYDGCFLSDNVQNALPNVYISWDGMDNHRETLFNDPGKGIYNAKQYPTWDAAKEIAFGIRGSFERLGWRGIAHHTRNVFQIQGHDLVTYTRFVLCWAEPRGKRNQVRGGTATAVKLAIELGIEVINLYMPRGFNRGIDFLNLHGVEHSFIKKDLDELV